MSAGSGDGAHTDSGAPSLERARAADSPPQPGLPPARADVRPGDCLGRYTVGSLIGAGGMGQVFAAVDGELGRPVALKLIRPADSASPSARARLVREAQALARLHHPNVVTVFEVGTQGETLFVAMELVDGPTLKAWLAARPRSWRQVRDVFVAAGRGLAAAHAAGIVHRDFKPHNVIVGAERVVVVDFGLARAGGERGDTAPHEAGPTEGRILDVGLTQTGQHVGTPRYMAPEQRAGGPVDARSDQFAFCVSLHEALYGRLPAEGEVPEATRAVPRFLAATIARGLARRSEERWPSMDALLEVLGRPFWTRPRRRLAATLGLALVAVVAALAFTAGRRVAAVDGCGDAEALVAPLWDAGARARVQAAFRRTGRLNADDVFARVDDSLRARLSTWSRAHRDVCEDSAVRHIQSDALLDLRMECLGQARREIGALVALLTEAEGSTVDRAMLAAADVGDVGHCGDVAALLQQAPPPRDPARAGEVERLRGELARLEALRRLGRMKDGLAVANEVVPATRRLGYPPFLASALYLAAWFEGYTGSFDRAIEDGYDAAMAAGAARDDRLAALAFSVVEYILAFEKRRFEAAEVAYRSALAAAARAGNPHPVLYLVFAHHAVALQAASRFAEELPINLLCLALATEVDGVESGQFAQSLRGLADDIVGLGDYNAALAIDRRALAIAERSVGRYHPFTMAIMNNTATTLMRLSDFDGAAELLQRLLALEEQVFGDDSTRMISTLHNLGDVRFEQRRLPDARALLERAIRVGSAKLGPTHSQLAKTYQDLGLVARAEGHAAEALADYQVALSIHLAAGEAPTPGLGDAYRDEADLYVALGKTADARVALAKALETDEKTLPADHPDHAETLRIEGDLERAEHHAAAAVRSYRRALAFLEQKLGAHHKLLVDALLGLSAALNEGGDPAGALAAAERAVATAGARPVTVERVAVAEFRRAQARFALRQDREGAVAAVEATRARLAALPYPAEILPEVQRWLARASR